MNYLRTAILLAGLTALFMGVGYLIGGAGGATIAFVIAAATNLFAYWNSDRMVLSMYGAHEVDRRTAPELVNLVAALAGRAGLPMPRVFLMDDPQPNAFATGRNPENAAVAVTTGLVQSLSREEPRDCERRPRDRPAKAHVSAAPRRLAYRVRRRAAAARRPGSRSTDASKTNCRCRDLTAG